MVSQLHPLRAAKYRESATTQPTATYVIQITTQAAGGAEPVKYEVRLVDPGNGQPLLGSYNGLAFEVDRSLIDRLSGDFSYTGKPAANEASPETPGPSFGPQ